MTNVEMVSTFPEGLKKALQSFGDVELKSTDELHEFMIKAREEFDLPPWHPFTLYIKEAAREIGCTGYAYELKNIWFTFSKGREEGNYEIPESLPIVHDWVYVKLLLSLDEGDKEEYNFVVQPKKNRIWNLTTETAVVAGERLNMQSKRMKNVHIKQKVLIDKAAKAVQKGVTHLEINVEHKTRAAKNAAEEHKESNREILNKLYSTVENFVQDNIVQTRNAHDTLTMQEIYSYCIKTIKPVGEVKEHYIRMSLGRAMALIFGAVKRKDIKGSDGKAKYGYCGYRFKRLGDQRAVFPTPVRTPGPVLDDAFKAAKTFTPLSKEEVAYLCVLLDMGRHKAIELGMEDTLHQWETIVQKLKDLYG